MTGREYNQARISWGAEFKDVSLFPIHYDGKSFQEVRDGRRMGNWVSADIVRPKLEGLDSFEAYVEMVRRTKINAPTTPSSFKFVYGETFCQMRDGVRFGGAQKASEAEVRRLIQGMTIPQYDEARKRWNASKRSTIFISAGEFPRIYGKGFMELRDGSHPLIPLETLLPFIQPLSQKRYIQKREDLEKKLGGRCPVPGKFPDAYGLTYGAAVGRGRGGLPIEPLVPLKKLRPFIRTMSQEEYARTRADLGKKLGGRCPCYGEFPKAYGVTYGQAVGREPGQPLNEAA
jgi:hypothetical protein